MTNEETPTTETPIAESTTETITENVEVIAETEVPKTETENGIITPTKTKRSGSKYDEYFLHLLEGNEIANVPNKNGKPLANIQIGISIAAKQFSKSHEGFAVKTKTDKENNCIIVTKK